MPVGEIGELAVKGPQVMKGYWNRPEETSMVLRNGWLYTGDIARMDSDGFFFIVDRKKEMIIAGGYNIYPREVEEVLYEHEKIKEAACYGVPDEYRGETVKIAVVLKDGQTCTAGRDHRLLQDEAGQVQGPQEDRVPEGAAQVADRQGPAPGAGGGGEEETAGVRAAGPLSRKRPRVR